MRSIGHIGEQVAKGNDEVCERNDYDDDDGADALVEIDLQNQAVKGRVFFAVSYCTLFLYSCNAFLIPIVGW